MAVVVVSAIFVVGIAAAVVAGGDVTDGAVPCGAVTAAGDAAALQCCCCCCRLVLLLLVFPCQLPPFAAVLVVFVIIYSLLSGACFEQRVRSIGLYSAFSIITHIIMVKFK